MNVPCGAAIEVLNVVFGSPLIFNDGHEILERLEAGDDLVDVVEDLSKKFGQPEMATEIRQVIENWPPLHLEAVSGMVRWALSKLDTDDRVTIRYKGDAEQPETVTKFELSGHELLIEFAHPPGSLQGAPASA